MPIERITQLGGLTPPARLADSHKGTYGRVLIIAGGRGMAGAASLAGLGALRGGAGLVYLAVPRGVANIAAVIEPSYLVHPLPEDENGFLDCGMRIADCASLSIDPTDATGGRCLCVPRSLNAVAIGPGLGTSDAVAKLVTSLYESFPGPAVFDADALNVLAERGVPSDPRGATRGLRIMTPHPGEFARLLGTDTQSVQADRENLAVRFAAERGVILLLKGHRTVITDGKRLAINETGNPGMATGGSGDVLTGVIAALLAQSMEPFEATRLAAHLHGLAGDIAAESLSQPGLIASDIARHLTQAWKKVSGE